MINIMDVVKECSSPALSALLKVVKRSLEIIQIIVPIILIVAFVINLIQLMNNPGEKKLVARVRNSILATVIIFFIPLAVDVVMGMLDDSFSISECWNSIEDYSGSSKYISPNGDKGNVYDIYTDPDDYQHGDPHPEGSSSGGSIEGTAQKIGDVVWDSSDVTKISNLTSTQLIGILNSYGGKAVNFVPYASALITAENKYSVNVFFLLGVEALESGWVTSKISRNCNNLGGVCASSNHPSNGCGSNSNCSFAYFNSAGDFIDYHASMLHENYLTPGGAYYHGTSPSGVVTSYCPGCSAWPGDVTSIATGLFKEAANVL